MVRHFFARRPWDVTVLPAGVMNSRDTAGDKPFSVADATDGPFESKFISA